MSKIYDFSQIITITGQSGAGKNIVKEKLIEIFNESDISFLSLSSGDLIRRCTESDTYFAQKIKSINDVGALTPEFVADTLVLNEILSSYKQGQIIIIDGGPRSVREVQNLHAWVASGFFDSLKVIEVLAPENICRNRLIERTKIDRRIDLSIDGKPGVPSIEKIQNKMSWWTSAEDEIRKYLDHYGFYTSINNNGHIDSIKENLHKIFLKSAQYS